MKSKGIKTDRGDIYNQVNGRNFEIRGWKQSALGMKQRMEPPRTKSIIDNNQALTLENISNLDLAIAGIDRQIEEIESNLAKVRKEYSEIEISIPDTFDAEPDEDEIIVTSEFDPECGEVVFYVETVEEKQAREEKAASQEVSRQEQNYNRGFGR